MGTNCHPEEGGDRREDLKRTKMMKMNRVFLAVAASVVLAAGCVKEQAGMEPAGDEAGIVADAPMIIAEQSEPLTRTCIDAAADATGKLPVLWEASDEVGVFFENGSSNAKYVNASGEVPNASFGAAAAVNGTTIKYVYYPYDAANDGKEATALSGNVPSEQAMDGSIHGDYKWGELKSQVEEGYKFKFYNIVSLVRFNIDATGTEMASETLKKVTLTVTRGDAVVPVTGSFTFSAADGSYTCGTTSNVLTTTWNGSLSSVQSGFASVLPEIEAGDQLNFLIETENYKATVTMTSKVAFVPGAYYTFPLTLSKLNKLRIVGDFTAATYNVDGLPDINYIFGSTNPDGPHSDGTKQISAKIATDNWDFVAFSEDFNYHTELMSSMTEYTFQEYDNEKLPTKYSLGITSEHWATDGLGFAGRNATCSFVQLAKVEFTSQAGGLTSGANTCVDKGFRHFLITMKDGTEIDVIITHMNTYSSSGSDHINAQHAQLKQVAQYINSIRSNNRPVIFMGDTNLRYTRHDFNTYFWSVLDSDLIVKDPWVEEQWEGKYPTYPSNSLMVSDATGTSSTDIICDDTQQGEVVDKIIYFNNPNANQDCQIQWEDYLRDYDNYNGLADHMPIVVDFSYSRKIKVN